MLTNPRSRLGFRLRLLAWRGAHWVLRHGTDDDVWNLHCEARQAWQRRGLPTRSLG